MVGWNLELAAHHPNPLQVLMSSSDNRLHHSNCWRHWF